MQQGNTAAEKLLELYSRRVVNFLLHYENFKENLQLKNCLKV